MRSIRNSLILVSTVSLVFVSSLNANACNLFATQRSSVEPTDVKPFLAERPNRVQIVDQGQTRRATYMIAFEQQGAFSFSESRFKIAAWSDLGEGRKYSKNHDSLLVNVLEDGRLVAAVADGMGELGASYASCNCS